MAWLAAAGVAVVLLLAVAARAQDDATPPPIDEALQTLLLAYQRDPLQHRQELIDTLRSRRRDLPPGLSLMLADALVSAGRVGEARRVLDDVLAAEPDPATESLARLGLGWMALAAGDVSRARGEFERLSGAGPHALLAATILGLIAASEGRGETAVSLLNSIVYADGTPEALTAVARLGMGYAYFWSGDFAQAAATFDEVARFQPDSPLADDGRYGAAWARYRDGDLVRAREGLTALAGSAAATPAGIPPGLVDLDPHVVFRTGMLRYEGQGGVAAESKLVAMLDRDGRVMAAAALRRIDAAPADRAQVQTAAAGVAPVDAATAVGEPPPAPDAATAARPGSLWLVMAALLAVALALVLMRRRRKPVSG